MSRGFIFAVDADADGKEDQMSNPMEVGAIFIRDSTQMPKTLRIESESYASGWKLVKDLDGDRLSRKIQDKGWTFFCLAGHIQATALGRDPQQGFRSAVRRMFAKVKLEKFNSLEITGIVAKHFLGLPYLTVSARARHIQDGVILFRDSDIQDWDQTNRAAA